MKSDVEKRVYELFWESSVSLRSKKEAEEFFLDLLTYTEKIMLAKRLAIAVLLMKDFGYRRIKEILKVSDPTITKVQNQLRSGSGGYERLAKRLAKEEFWREFADILNQIFPRYSRRPVPKKVFRRKTPL